MRELINEGRKIARELLEDKQVDLIIGWEKGTFEDKTTPLFIKKTTDVDRLIINEFCSSNLTPYLLKYKNHQGKIALFLKGCDSRGILRLLQDKQIKRENIYIIGVPCSGLKQINSSGEVIEEPKCTGCTHPNPVIYDFILGEKRESKNPEGRFAIIEEDTDKSAKQTWDYWKSQFEKCIRCYACQRVCPACNCRQCIFVDRSQEWIERRVDGTENAAYSLIRAYHVAGRCVECGECERACPVGLPLMKLNKRIAKDIEELFGPYEAGVDIEEKPPIGHFKHDDPEEFL